MKKILYVTLAMVMTMLNAWAGPVDEMTARDRAQQFVNNRSGDSGTLKAKLSGDVTLIYTEMSNVVSGQAAYYIYDTDDSFIIVAGDDRVQGVLAYGDAPIDLNNIPCGLQYLLDLYKGEVDYLFVHPELSVMDIYPVMLAAPATRAGDVAPLLTEMWNQTEPYYNFCPEYLGERCVTGCSCTSLSMVLHHWSYANLTSDVPAYTTQSLGIFLDALPVTTFDWENMLDCYAPGGYTDEQADAVALLMRYVGQSECMNYAPDGSGASDNSILATVKRFGYSPTATLLKKGSYSEQQWRDLMRAELQAGRPIVYTGFDNGGTVGHAFNVDGYDAENGLFHINFGWAGYGNAYCALNDFSASGYTFSNNQSMIIGIQPPDEVQPELTVSPTNLMLSTHTGKSVSKTISVFGKGLNGDLNIQLDDASGYYQIDKVTLSAAEAINGATVKVSFNPAEVGVYAASITISADGVEPQTVALNGVAIAQPLTVTPAQLSFEAEVGTTCTASFTVTGDNLPGKLSLALNDATGVYAIDKTSITAAEAASGATVMVTYSPVEAGSTTACVTISGIGAETATVALVGTAVEPQPVGDPSITTSVGSLDFGKCYNGYRENRSLVITGKNLSADITLSISGPRAIDFSIRGPEVITPEEAAQGVEVTVSSFPYSEGVYYDLYLVISCQGLPDLKVPITGKGIKTGAYLYPDKDTLEFETAVGRTVSMQVGVKKVEFNGWIAGSGRDVVIDDTQYAQVVTSIIGVIEGDDCFRIKSARQQKTDDGCDSVIFSLEYCPLHEGAHHAQLVLSTLSLSYPAHPLAVELNGFATGLGYLPGDMDGDGMLTLDDLDLLIQAVNGKVKALLDNPAADVNGDDRVSLQDIIDLIDLLLQDSYFK